MVGEEVTTVILAGSVQEAEVIAVERGLPPRSLDVMLISTGHTQGLRRLRGLALARDDVTVAPSAHRGRYMRDYERQLETLFYD